MSFLDNAKRLSPVIQAYEMFQERRRREEQDGEEFPIDLDMPELGDQDPRYHLPQPLPARGGSIGAAGLPAIPGNAGSAASEVLRQAARYLADNPGVLIDFKNLVARKKASNQGQNLECYDVYFDALPVHMKEALYQYSCGLQTPFMAAGNASEHMRAAFNLILLAEAGYKPSPRGGGSCSCK